MVRSNLCTSCDGVCICSMHYGSTYISFWLLSYLRTSLHLSQVQAWWRGTMVRKCLGPYAKAKKKDKKKKGGKKKKKWIRCLQSQGWIYSKDTTCMHTVCILFIVTTVNIHTYSYACDMVTALSMLVSSCVHVMRTHPIARTAKNKVIHQNVGAFSQFLRASKISGRTIWSDAYPMHAFVPGLPYCLQYYSSNPSVGNTKCIAHTSIATCTSLKILLLDFTY